jgi:uncharacterized protein (DUF2236 family)
MRSGSSRATDHIVTGMLPASVRRLFGLRRSPLHEQTFRTLAAGVRRSRAVVPDRMRIGGNRGLRDSDRNGA